MKVYLAIATIILSATGLSYATHTNVSSIGSKSTFVNPVPVCTTGITYTTTGGTVNKTQIAGVNRSLCPAATKLYFNAIDSSGTSISSGSVTLTSSSTYSNVPLSPNLVVKQLSAWKSYIS